MNVIQQKIIDKIDNIKDEIFHLANFIYEQKEIGLEEYNSSARLKEYLSDKGFEIEDDFPDMPTAFVARYRKGNGPKIGICAEYDALPNIGHACGHHVIAALSVASAVGLKEALSDVSGEIIVFGTPSEETGDGKPYLVEKGYFKDVDVAMMVHPHVENSLDPKILAITGYDFKFTGKPSHASAAPHEGINALDAAILTFTNINALRQQIRDDARIHGIMIEGGDAVNIIPSHSKLRLEIRAADNDYFEELIQRVINCAKAAELATGCSLEYQRFEPICDSMKTNYTLLDRFVSHMREFGLDTTNKPSVGSTDMGNVSQICPAIHPFIKMVDIEGNLHTVEFLEAIQKKEAYERFIEGAKILALTANDVLCDMELLEAVKAEFKRGFIS